jgi:hypothetical protein
MAKEFGKVSSSIWHSRRFNLLPTDSARLSFLYLVTNEHGNPINTYRLPPAYLAADRGISPQQAEEDLKDLRTVRLIDYDDKERVVHIYGWARAQKFTNRKHQAAGIFALSQLPPKSAVTALGAASLMVASYRFAASYREAILTSNEGIETKRRKLGICEEAENRAKKAVGNLLKVHSLCEYTLKLCEPSEFDVIQRLAEALGIELSEALCIELSIELPIGLSPQQRKTTTITTSETPYTSTPTPTILNLNGERGRGGEEEPSPSADAPSPLSGGAPAQTKRKSVMLEHMARRVKAVARGEDKPPIGSLAPTPQALASMLVAGLISEEERDAYLGKV